MLTGDDAAVPRTTGSPRPAAEPRRARDSHAPGACGGPPDGVAERRLRRTLPQVRDWITDLRARGGDFDADAAAAAGETALRLHRAGLSPEDAFQAARTEYYDALARRGPSDTAIPSNGRRTP
ncbi:MAG TPA: hypothetical protein VHJ34_13580 [Actinomycetota bacterium]|nr:hypothetical protein [Actinomycetota bacterium]